MNQDLLIYMKAQDMIEAIALRVVQHLKADCIQGCSENSEIEAPIPMPEACALLRVSRPTLNRWMKQGKIPFYRKGRRVYFFKSKILKSLEQPKHSCTSTARKSNRGFTTGSTYNSSRA